jgi:phage terminase small subunit
MMRNEIKNKTNLKKHQIKKKKDQTQNKYKPKDIIEFVKALHVYQGLGERKQEEEKKKINHRKIAAQMTKRATLKDALPLFTSGE